MTVPSSAHSEIEGRQRLAELGLTAEALRDAIKIGYGHAAGCTNHDPRSLPGTLAWGKGTGHLRDILKLQGWTPDSDSNYETVVHPTNALAVALAAGTADTGRRDGSPAPRPQRDPRPAVPSSETRS